MHALNVRLLRHTDLRFLFLDCLLPYATREGPFSHLHSKPHCCLSCIVTFPDLLQALRSWRSSRPLQCPVAMRWVCRDGSGLSAVSHWVRSRWVGCLPVCSQWGGGGDALLTFAPQSMWIHTHTLADPHNRKCEIVHIRYALRLLSSRWGASMCAGAQHIRGARQCGAGEEIWIRAEQVRRYLKGRAGAGRGRGGSDKSGTM